MRTIAAALLITGSLSGQVSYQRLLDADREPGRLLESASLEWGFPVVFFEHKLLYGVIQDRGGYEVVVPDVNDPGAGLFPTLVRRQQQPDLTIAAVEGSGASIETVPGMISKLESPRSHSSCMTEAMSRRTPLVRWNLSSVDHSP